MKPNNQSAPAYPMPILGIGKLDLWRLTGIGICIIVSLPVFALIYLAAIPSENIWPHLLNTVLPRQTITTLALMAGVACLTGSMGTLSAWLITFFEFPGRRLLTWAMLLPLALPTYLAAYAYSDLLDYAGPIYGLWRDYLPDIRPPAFHSLGGGIILLSLVLYPYVYISARASFLQQSTGLLENARMLGVSPRQSFWRIGLPVARPAIALGILLALMECLNDIGAVEHLGIETLTIGVYNTWIVRGNLGGAAQMAISLLGFMALLLYLERRQRQSRHYQSSRLRNRAVHRFSLSRPQALMAMLACSLPVILGFVIPVILLAQQVRLASFNTQLLTAAQNSVGLAIIAGLLTCGVALFIAYAHRSSIPISKGSLARFAALGYAIPGTVLGIGLMILLGFVTELTNGAILLTGSLTGLVYAYLVRFLSLAYGTLNDGFERLPRNLDMAARSLGKSRSSIIWLIHRQLMKAPIIAAFLMVFVDAMKELPATLILRPFNFETLSTQVYGYASLGQIEDAAMPALIIIAIGLIPIIIMMRFMDRLREG